MKVAELQTNEYAPYFSTYLQLVDDLELIDGLETTIQDFETFLIHIPQEKQEYSYAPGKWTIKDIMQHLIDTERILAYRALRFARKDQTPLSGFEEDDYAQTAFANQRSFLDLMEEYKAVRKATLFLFASFSEEQFKQIGMASEKNISVMALGFIIIGHQLHHQKVIRERYL